MKRNRLILLSCIVAAVVFASFYGGVSYLILFMMFTVPFVSFLYLLFVFFRFKITQEADRYTVNKGEQTRYKLILANEDKIAYTGVKLNFFTGLSELSGIEGEIERGLLPGDRFTYEGQLLCRYRGAYSIGVETVTVTDFLNLFHLKHKPLDPVTVTVLPRIIPIGNLALLPLEEDAKQTPFPLSAMHEQPDIESRLYRPGDSRKTINWKLSARQQELMVRKYIDIPKTQVVVLLDLTRLQDRDAVSRVVIEDKLIETALAIVNHFFRKGISVDILYGRSSLVHFPVRGQASFDTFYRVCAEVPFASAVPAAALLGDAVHRYDRSAFCILLTAALDDEVCAAVSDAFSLNANQSVICVDDKPAPERRRLLNEQVPLLRLSVDDDIASTLESSKGGAL